MLFQCFKASERPELELFSVYAAIQLSQTFGNCNLTNVGSF